MTDTLPLAQVKASLSEVLDGVVREQDRVTITRRGRPVAVLLSVEDLEGLEETLSILSDSSEREAVRRGVAEAEAGETVPLDELTRDLGKRQRVR